MNENEMAKSGDVADTAENTELRVNETTENGAERLNRKDVNNSPDGDVNIHKQEEMSDRIYGGMGESYENARHLLNNIAKGVDMTGADEEAETPGYSVGTAGDNYSDLQKAVDMQMDLIRYNTISNRIKNDMREIQAIDPTVMSVDDLPPEYMALRFSEVAPMKAGMAYSLVKAMAKAAKPPSTGSVTGTGNTEREFFTGEELDRLKKDDLSDPAVMEKAMRSMARLK